MGTVEALLAERGPEDRIWGSMVKQALKRRKPGFNESYFRLCLVRQITGRSGGARPAGTGRRREVRRLYHQERGQPRLSHCPQAVRVRQRTAWPAKFRPSPACGHPE